MANEQVCSETGEKAIYHYRWDWGEEGYASTTGRQLLEQKAVNLRRPKNSGQPIIFNLLHDDTVQPLELEERAMLHGRIIALTEELKIKAEKNVTLHNNLTSVSRDLRISEANRVSLENQLGEASKSVGLLQNQLLDSKREAAKWEEQTQHYKDLVTGDDSQAMLDLRSKVNESLERVSELEAERDAAQNRVAELEAAINQATRQD